MNIFSN